MPSDSTTLPSPDLTLAELMRGWPALVPVLLHRRMACPGCAMAPFMTLREAARAYAVEADALLSDLGAALAGEAPAGPFLPPLAHGGGRRDP